MKAIKNIQISPDLVGSLCTIFFEDNTKLAVTVEHNPGQPVYAECVIGQVERALSLPDGMLAGSLIGPFCAGFHRVTGTESFTVACQRTSNPPPGMYGVSHVAGNLDDNAGDN